MRNRFVNAATVVLLSAAFVGVVTTPAIAAPECDVPNPPPICGTEDEFGSPTISLSTPVRQPAGLVVSGTAKDRDASGPVQVQIKIGGAVVATLAANRSTGAYSGTVPARAGSSVCAVAKNQNEGLDKSICRTFLVSVDPIGSVDEVSPGPAGLRVRGWSIDPDTANPIDVHVYLDGAYVRTVNASGSRPDVAAVHPPYGAAHGYDLTVPAGPGQHTVCVYGINVGTGTVNTQLGCGTVTQGSPPAAPDLQVNAAQTVPTMYLYVQPRSTNASGFVVERSVGGSAGPWVQVHSNNRNGETAFSWDDTGVSQGNQYCYRVRADNPYGSATSAVVCRDLPLPALPRPTNVSVTGVTETSLVLNWTDNAVGETQYRVDHVGVNTMYAPGTAGTGPMTFTMNNLQPSTRYCFKMGPIKTGFGYDPAPEICATTASPPPPPPLSVKTVNLWNCVSSGASGGVWLYDHDFGTWTRAASAPSSWVRGSCGTPYSGPAASVNLPDGRVVTVVLVIAGNKFCTTEDPTQTACRHWEAGPVLGGSKGITTYDVIG
ncbi:fibronectin type III domain-containing protein [Micromonospora sp. NPDC004704]